MAAVFSRTRSGRFNRNFNGNSLSESDSDGSVYPMLQSDSEGETPREVVSSLGDPESVQIYPEASRISARKDTQWRIRCLALILCCIVPLVLLVAMILAASAHAFG